MGDHSFEMAKVVREEGMNWFRNGDPDELGQVMRYAMCDRDLCDL
jgi:hypothetical protein